MKVYQSTKEVFAKGYVDFDRVIFCAAIAPPPPASCGSFLEFSVLSQAVTAACCTAGVECPPGGIPTTCTPECASVLLPMQVRTNLPPSD